MTARLTGRLRRSLTPRAQELRKQAYEKRALRYELALMQAEARMRADYFATVARMD